MQKKIVPVRLTLFNEDISLHANNLVWTETSQGKFLGIKKSTNFSLANSLDYPSPVKQNIRGVELGKFEGIFQGYVGTSPRYFSYICRKIT
jgi:hypothetical protein